VVSTLKAKPAAPVRKKATAKKAKPARRSTAQTRRAAR
jgi:hypothetical protein